MLRQISALIASLPSANAPGFRAELQAVCLLLCSQVSSLMQQEQEDVRLTSLLSELTRQVDALSGVSRYLAGGIEVEADLSSMPTNIMPSSRLGQVRLKTSQAWRGHDPSVTLGVVAGAETLQSEASSHVYD